MSHHHPWRYKTRRRYAALDGYIRSYLSRDIPSIEFDAQICTILSIIRHERYMYGRVAYESHVLMADMCGAMRELELELEILSTIHSNRRCSVIRHDQRSTRSCAVASSSAKRTEWHRVRTDANTAESFNGEGDEGERAGRRRKRTAGPSRWRLERGETRGEEHSGGFGRLRSATRVASGASARRRWG